MTKQTKLQRLVKLMQRRWVSPQDALHHCGLMSLSQRCDTLRSRGVNVASKWVKDASGRNAFKAYKIVTGKGC